MKNELNTKTMSIPADPAGVKGENMWGMTGPIKKLLTATGC